MSRLIKGSAISAAVEVTYGSDFISDRYNTVLLMANGCTVVCKMNNHARPDVETLDPSGNVIYRASLRLQSSWPVAIIAALEWAP